MPSFRRMQYEKWGEASDKSWVWKPGNEANKGWVTSPYNCDQDHNPAVHKLAATTAKY